MRDDLIEHSDTVVGGCEPDSHDLPHGLGVQVEAPPGCAPVRHAHQHHGGEILDPLQPEIVRAQSGFARTPVEQILCPSGCVLAEHGLAERAHVPATELSGGQKQLLALASVLITEPALLVADDAEVDQRQIAWTGRGRVKDATGGTGGRRIILVGSSAGSEVRVKRG
ncbi:ATP-binding cassette domain-containing protein, partial [Mucilaginibacter gynuensis]|uniref:ATP-binding cassette domain-containing protein n=1 Tax=Mucilaginibacter gynuensis TaxID=1302236 RepID=UPI003CD08167